MDDALIGAKNVGAFGLMAYKAGNNDLVRKDREINLLMMGLKELLAT